MTTPSPAAMRAAKAIYISLIVDVAQRRQLPDESELASIIDAEMGTPKVVEAMELAMSVIDPDEYHNIYVEVRDALAAMKGDTAAGVEAGRKIGESMSDGEKSTRKWFTDEQAQKSVDDILARVEKLEAATTTSIKGLAGGFLENVEVATITTIDWQRRALVAEAQVTAARNTMEVMGNLSLGGEFWSGYAAGISSVRVAMNDALAAMKGATNE